MWCKEKPFLTLEEFLQECVYWALKDGFDEIAPKQYPQKCLKVLEYEEMSLVKRIKLDNRFYDDFPEIMKYYKTKLWVDNQNRANLLWLKEILGYIPQEDTFVQDKIKARIKEFDYWKDKYNPLVEKIVETFDAEEI